MIIFDYSGTLSLEAPLFAEHDFLMQQLEECGLQNFGIDSPHDFWEKLVNTTWIEGSTTARGYKKVLETRILATLHSNLSMPSRTRLADAVAAFVDRYFGHSGIDARWKPVLQGINTQPCAKAVIATDHYAEATVTIIQFLGEWQIRAAKVAEAALNPQAASFIVANSADLGVHKTDPRFWQILKAIPCLDAMRRILIIDDFGYNEQGADDYSKRHRVEARMKETVRTLETVFSAAVEVFPFMIGMDATDRDARTDTLIAQASAAIERHLTLS